MRKRRIGQGALVATTIAAGQLVESNSSSSSSVGTTRSSHAAIIDRWGRAGASSSSSSLLLRDYSDTDDDGPAFFGNFQDEIRKMREEIEMETTASFEQLRNELLVRKTQKFEESRNASNSFEGAVNVMEPSLEEDLHESKHTNEKEMVAPREIPNVVENTEQVKTFQSIMKKTKRGQQRKQLSSSKKKIIHKSTNSLANTMPRTHMAAVSVSGGGVKPVVHNKKQIHQEKLFLAEETDELLTAKRMLQSELEHSGKVMSQNELYRVMVTGVLLLLLCLVTTLTLRVVEASLGVP
jgi:hypothetical protein